MKAIFSLLCFAICICVPLQSFGAAAISNGIRNFAAEQIAEKGTKYALSDKSQSEHISALVEGASRSVGAATTIGAATMGAAAAGAGPLAGYAGIASAISSLGLGSVTTLGASALGYTGLTGAAATAVCTTAVGGPVIMGAIVVGGVGAVGYGVYRGASAAYDWVKSKW